MSIGLDVGDAVSGAGRVANALDKIAQAKARAEKEGRGNDVAKLAADHEGLQRFYAGGALSGHSEALGGVIRDMDARIVKAREAGNHSDVGNLYAARDMLKASAAGMERDAGNLLKDPKFLQIMDKKAEGRALTQGEEQYFSRLDALNATLRKNTEALLDANRAGDVDELLRQSSKAGAGAAGLREIVGEGGAASGQGTRGAVMSMALAQISGAISSGLGRWTGSLDRSGIVAQYGSGDILGARLSERRRQDNLAGGAADAIAGVSNLLAFLGPKGILAAGVVNLGAGIFNSVRQGRTNVEATNVAKAELWQRRSGQAMELAALLGRPGGVRDAFGIAAADAARFGFSAEEGMAAMGEAARQGLGRDEARAATRRVFEFERATGADRGTLSSLANMSARFGGGDALGNAWAGLQASGMSSGQFNEYLRAVQRVMEDGINRGFVRSSEDVAKNLTMLSQMTGNDPLWQGEHGARRLSEMNAGLAAATGLGSATDVIAFRAAMELERECRLGDERYIGRGYAGEDIGHIYGMKKLERGLTPELFERIMRLTGYAEGDATEGIIHRMMDTFGLGHIPAHALYTAWRGGKHGTSEQLRSLTGRQVGPPTANSAELEAARLTQGITNWWTQTGQVYWDRTFLPALREEFRLLRGGNERPPPPPPSRVEQEIRDVHGLTRGQRTENFREILPNRARIRYELGRYSFILPMRQGNDMILSRITSLIHTAAISQNKQQLQYAVDVMNALTGTSREDSRDIIQSRGYIEFARANTIEQLLRMIEEKIGVTVNITEY